MFLKKNTKNGYFILEATIFLPIFLIAILTIGYLIKVASIEENVTHIMVDEASKLARDAYVTSFAPTFKYILKDRIMAENTNIQELDITQFSYLYQSANMDGQIKIKVDYTIDVKLPLHFYDGFTREMKLGLRGFIGNRREIEAMPFSEMEEKKESCIVWVFPRTGERYHKENCKYIKVDAKQVLLTKVIKRKYDACGICSSKNLPDGAVVYCFFTSGEAYHTGKCSTVDRYVIPIEEEDAIKQGYTPCQKCGGS